MLHYIFPDLPLIYIDMLKFDIAHSMNQYHQKEMTVRESPTGMLIVNGKAIHVFAEHDVTKIPWELSGVNYVIEATDALNTKAEASLHIKKSKKGLRMKHILEIACGTFTERTHVALNRWCNVLQEAL